MMTKKILSFVYDVKLEETLRVQYVRVFSWNMRK
jgi:hypothetical protein